MKIKILQSIANGIINRLENASHDDIFNFYLELGMWYDNFCIIYLDLYLD
jgi:hypothetical protein